MLKRLAWQICLVCTLLAVTSNELHAMEEGPPDPAPWGGWVVRVSFADAQDLQQLTARYDVWQVDPQTRQATLWVTLAQWQRLVAESRRVVVDPLATAQAAYAQAAASQTAIQTAGIPGYSCYRTVEESYASLQALAERSPMLVREVKIGESWQYVRNTGQQGYELRGVVLTNRARPGPKPVFLLIGAIHAREYTTAETALRFAERLVHSYGVDADVTWLLDHVEVHVIPQANPDGRKRAEAGLWWRKNVNRDACGVDSDSYGFGVDLNRNSSFKWNQCTSDFCSSSDPCALTYRGPVPASEPETQALESYLRTIFPDRRGAGDNDPVPADASGVMVTLHSYSPLILYPWGWTEAAAPNGDALRTLARKFGYYTGYPACQSGADGCIYMTDGTTDDFAYGELGVAAFTFELGWRFFESCTTFESLIVTPALASLTYAAKAALRPYELPSGPEIASATLEPPGWVAAGEPVTLTVTADDTRFASGGYGDEPVQPIQAVRYSIDTPSWVSGTLTQPLAPLAGVFTGTAALATAAISTEGLTPGTRLLLIEAQDAGGTWGVPTAIFLQIGKIPSLYLPLVQR